jgi:hypothetical protein
VCASKTEGDTVVDYRQVARQTLDELKVPDDWRSDTGDAVHCRHPRKELRLRTIKGDKTALFFQCLVCGQSAGGGAQAKTLANVAGARRWDVDLERRFRALCEHFYERCRANFDSAKLAEAEDWQARYAAHVNPDNPAWQAIRRKVLRRCGGVCEGCLEKPAAHVHHLTYAHLGNELLFELRGVCRDCHRVLHPDRFQEGTLLKPLPQKG